MPKRRAAALAGLLFLAGCGGAANAPSVEQARVNLPAVPGVPGAGYFVLKGGSGDALVAVTSPAAERIEMHETTTDTRGVTSMRPVAEAALDGEDVMFEPGGRHLMLFGMRDDLSPGQTIPLTFRFRAAPAVTVEARLTGPGGDGHAMH
jgi:periplasmic copper chaperone A